MAIDKREIAGSFIGIKGETFEVDILRITFGGADITAPQLSAATITGTIGGVPVTGVVVDPEAGVRLRASCSPSTTAYAVPSADAYLSDLRLEFSSTVVRKIRFLFTVLDSPTA